LFEHRIILLSLTNRLIDAKDVYCWLLDDTGDKQASRERTQLSGDLSVNDPSTGYTGGQFIAGNAALSPREPWSNNASVAYWGGPRLNRPMQNYAQNVQDDLLTDGAPLPKRLKRSLSPGAPCSTHMSVNSTQLKQVPGGSDGVDHNESLDVSCSRDVERVIERLLKTVTKKAVIKIVKKWIKVICPSKQDDYPYQGIDLPPWWPGECPFLDPDRMVFDRKSDRDAGSTIMD
jgi:hypothetical protein